MSDEKHTHSGELTAEAFLRLVHQKELVASGTLADLRKKIAESKTRVPARQVAKLLVDKGMLTAAIARELLESGSNPPVKPAPAGAAPAKPADSPKASTKSPPPKPAANAAPIEIEPLIDNSLGSLLDEELSSSGGISLLGGGPLDALMSDPSLGGAVQELSPLDVPASPKKSPKRPSGGAEWSGRRRKWRRVVIWIGVAAAGIVAIVVTSIWIATRPDPAKVLEPADAAYQAGSYADAIQQYDDYLNRYPGSAAAGRSRVRRGLARLRLALAQTPGELAGMAAAKAILSEIGSEAEFDAESGPILATLLPPIAEGFAARVQKHPDAASMTEAEEMLAIAQRYIPASDKPRERLGKVESILALARQRLASGDALKKATAAIEKSVDAKDLKEAYRIRTALVNEYPQFATYDELTEEVAKISAAEEPAVTWIAKPQPPEKEPRPATVPTTIVAARNFTASPQGTEGRVILAVAAGAVYGLDASTGKVLWRIFVGFDPDGRNEGCMPSTIGPPDAADVVLAAAGHREVWRVAVATGQVKWRVQIDEGLCGDPVVAGSQILAPTRNRRLVAIETYSGKAAGSLQFPQALCGTPAVDEPQRLAFQAADSDTLFVLPMAARRCLQVVPLGHRPGSIVTPPAVFGDYLLVAINDTASDSSLRVFEIRPGEPQPPTPTLRLVQTISLKGHVDVGPSVAGERLLLTTDNGDVHLWERSSERASPLREVTRLHLEGGMGLVRFPLLQAGTFLVGDMHLASFEIDPSKTELSPAWRDTIQGAVSQPPVAIGQAVFCVRRTGDLPGVTVSAMSADKGTLYWQTCLAAPLVGEPAVSPDGRKVTVVTGRGGVFVLPVPGSKGLEVIDQPVGWPSESVQTERNGRGSPSSKSPPIPSRPVIGVIRYGEKLLLTGGGESDELFAVDPLDLQKPLASWKLPTSLACSPIALANGALAPLGVGQVFLLDPLSGKTLCSPFQPRLQSGALPAWRGPVAVGEKEAVISDGRKRIYRLQLLDQPALHLSVAAEVQTAEKIISPLASTGKAVCGVDAEGKLDFYQLPALTRSQQHTLAGRLAWGPSRAGDRVILATDAGQYYCFDESGQQVWQAALPYGRLAGTPLAIKDRYLLAAANGIVWQVEAASGNELGKVDVGLPLATGPVLLGDRLLLGGHDGSVYQVALPHSANGGE